MPPIAVSSFVMANVVLSSSIGEESVVDVRYPRGPQCHVLQLTDE